MTPVHQPPCDGLERVTKILDRIERDMYSTDPTKPGISMRLDRIERMFKWFGAGSLSGVALTIYLLWRIGELISETGVS